MSANGVKVKICGLRDAATAQVAVKCGADALGFILAPSLRQIAAADVLAIRRELSGQFTELPLMVGVVVNATAQEIEKDVQDAGFDMIQLSGDEDPALVDQIDVPVIRAARLPHGLAADDARREISRWLDRANPASHIIVEGHAAGLYGGTGTRADWALVAALAEEFPLWLAGGLTSDIVAQAIAAVRPLGVDVSSGIETDGVKDLAKIDAFIANAQAALHSAS